MATTTTGCTFNVGSNHTDYLELYKHLNPDHIMSFGTKIEEDSMKQFYEKIEGTVGKTLVGKADFYCIQEGGKKDRPFLKAFDEVLTESGEKRYTIVHYVDPSSGATGFDAAVILDNERYTDVVNRSFLVKKSNPHNGERVTKDVAVVTAVDRITKQPVVIASIHTPGYDLSLSPVPEEESGYGVVFCEAVQEKLAELGKGRLQIVGADMNAKPEQEEMRFTAFTERSFTVLRSNASTDVNSWKSPTTGQVIPERELDFLLVKDDSVVESDPMLAYQTKSTFSHIELEFDPITNCSDRVAPTISTEVVAFDQVEKEEEPTPEASVSTVGGFLQTASSTVTAALSRFLF